jgi:hypothetical protein
VCACVRARACKLGGCPHLGHVSGHARHEDGSRSRRGPAVGALGGARAEAAREGRLGRKGLLRVGRGGGQRVSRDGGETGRRGGVGARRGRGGVQVPRVWSFPFERTCSSWFPNWDARDDPRDTSGATNSCCGAAPPRPSACSSLSLSAAALSCAMYGWSVVKSDPSVEEIPRKGVAVGSSCLVAKDHLDGAGGGISRALSRNHWRPASGCI